MDKKDVIIVGLSASLFSAGFIILNQRDAIHLKNRRYHRMVVVIDTLQKSYMRLVEVMEPTEEVRAAVKLNVEDMKFATIIAQNDM